MTSCARHSYYYCFEQNCQSVSNLDASLFHGKKDKFRHKWLSDKVHTYCHKTGFFWLLYAEGKGMYCILSSKHKTRNKQSQANIFTGKPGTRYKKSALKSHAYSDRHKAAIEAELLQKNWLRNWQIKLLRETRLSSLLLYQHIGWQNMKWPTANCCPFLNFLKHQE